MKGPIAEGELPKCKNFGQKIAKIATMKDFVEWTVESDKVVTF